VDIRDFWSLALKREVAGNCGDQVSRHFAITWASNSQDRRSVSSLYQAIMNWRLHVRSRMPASAYQQVIQGGVWCDHLIYSLLNMRRDGGLRLLKGGFEFVGRHIADASGALPLVFQNAGTRSHLISRWFGKKAGATLSVWFPPHVSICFGNSPIRTALCAGLRKGKARAVGSVAKESLTPASLVSSACITASNALTWVMPYFSPSAPRDSFDR
jgi:hypothetical protein